MSGQMRVAIAAGYAVLLAVNGIFGSGAFGVPTNAEHRFWRRNVFLLVVF